jgi:hypothetical protein
VEEVEEAHGMLRRRPVLAPPGLPPTSRRTTTLAGVVLRGDQADKIFAGLPTEGIFACSPAHNPQKA